MLNATNKRAKCRLDVLGVFAGFKPSCIKFYPCSQQLIELICRTPRLYHCLGITWLFFSRYHLQTIPLCAKKSISMLFIYGKFLGIWL